MGGVEGERTKTRTRTYAFFVTYRQIVEVRGEKLRLGRGGGLAGCRRTRLDAEGHASRGRPQVAAISAGGATDRKVNSPEPFPR